MTKSRLVAVAAFVAGLAVAPIINVAAMGDASHSAFDLAFLDNVIQLVQRAYVHPVDSDTLTQDALKGMLGRLDPHSDYMNEQEFKEFAADTSGKFGGLGMQISEQNGVPKVISPIDGTPAAQAGLRPGDLIVLIDHRSTQGVDLRKVVGLLRGDPGSTVTITISRGTQAPFDVTLTRQIIHVKSVKAKLEPNGIGYIRISQFAADTGPAFKQAIKDLKQEAHGSINGLVVDLRNDPGGLLSAAVDVSGDLLNGGRIVSIRGRLSDNNQTYEAPKNGDLLPGVPITVLINGASASASEIVAGALQDRHRATVMGTQSFGKGSVQTVIPLKGHGALRLTTALYYTPSDRSIQDDGIAPDKVVEAPKDEQISNAVMLRESTLSGAFSNPGPLTSKTNASAAQPAARSKSAYSPPIKAELIGTPEDAQLKAVLSYLDRAATTARMR